MIMASAGYRTEGTDVLVALYSEGLRFESFRTDLLLIEVYNNFHQYVKEGSGNVVKIVTETAPIIMSYVVHSPYYYVIVVHSPYYCHKLSTAPIIVIRCPQPLLLCHKLSTAPIIMSYVVHNPYYYVIRCPQFLLLSHMLTTAPIIMSYVVHNPYYYVISCPQPLLLCHKLSTAPIIMSYAVHSSYY
jgi:hypothetical protein